MSDNAVLIVHGSYL